MTTHNFPPVNKNCTGMVVVVEENLSVINYLPGVVLDLQS